MSYMLRLVIYLAFIFGLLFILSGSAPWLSDPEEFKALDSVPGEFETNNP